MKKIFFSIFIICISIISVYALSSNFTIDSDDFSFSKNNKKSSILSNFNQEYNLINSIEQDDSEIEKEIEELSKKITFLLLGRFNKTNESSEEYYKRYKEYLDLRYDPEIPKTETGEFDENSQEYKDDVVSGISVPGMFLVLDELKINYSSFGNIRVMDLGDVVISSITLPNVVMKEESKENPLEYVNVRNNFTLYYFFKELNGKYKLYYLFGETSDDLDEYFTEIENEENKSVMQVVPTYNSNLKDVYNFSKLSAISQAQLNNIYNANSSNILILNSYYNNYLVASAHGFFINDGLLVTTWSYLEKSLIEAQYIAVKDSNGISYEIDGIVTANPDTDVVVLKLKNKVNNKVVLGNSNNLKIEDPVISISSKTGVGLSAQGGIVISNDGYISTSIPLVESDGGSPLFNSMGEVIGMNTSNQVNTSVSSAINSDVLKEIQDKFNNIAFDKIEYVSFKKLKEEYYYVKYNNEIIKNDIPNSKWKKYKKIGNIEETIPLELIKASYKDGVVSLRYHNGVSQFIDSMQLAGGFREQLIKEGFKEKLLSSKKHIYENKKYKVVIINEFDYLIVVMMKL